MKQHTDVTSKWRAQEPGWSLEPCMSPTPIVYSSLFCIHIPNISTFHCHILSCAPYLTPCCIPVPLPGLIHISVYAEANMAR